MLFSMFIFFLTLHEWMVKLLNTNKIQLELHWVCFYTNHATT